MGSTLAIEDRVPNAPFREKVLEAIAHEEITFGEFASRVGWMAGTGRRAGDGTYLRRVLGLLPWAQGDTPSEWMSYPAAVKLCDALGLDPVDLGI